MKMKVYNTIRYHTPPSLLTTIPLRSSMNDRGRRLFFSLSLLDWVHLFNTHTLTYTATYCSDFPHHLLYIVYIIYANEGALREWYGMCVKVSGTHIHRLFTA